MLKSNCVCSDCQAVRENKLEYDGDIVCAQGGQKKSSAKAYGSTIITSKRARGFIDVVWRQEHVVFHEVVTFDVMCKVFEMRRQMVGIEYDVLGNWRELKAI